MYYKIFSTITKPEHKTTPIWNSVNDSWGSPFHKTYCDINDIRQRNALQHRSSVLSPIPWSTVIVKADSLL